MIAQIKSETRKLVTTRTPLYLLLGAVVLSVMAALVVDQQNAAAFAFPLERQQFMFLGTFVKLIALVLGIRIVTDEHRYGTMMPTASVTPRRARVVAAKSMVAGAAGLVLGVIAQTVLLGAASFLFANAGHDLVLTDAPQAVVGGVLATGLWALLGVGIGLVVRGQVGAIVGSFVWLMGLEETVRSQLGDLAAYLPGQGGLRLSLAPDVAAVGSGALTLGLYALVALGAGLLLFRRRDVT